jgi:hypothetical protein
MRSGAAWSGYSYRYGLDQRTAEVRFDLAFATGAAPPTHLTTIRLVVVGDGQAFEAALPSLLAEVDCLLVGILRYGSTTEFVLQVEDVAGFAEREAALTAEAGALHVHRSAGWDYFDDRVCPREHDWQRITDRETAEALVAAGADPLAHHVLEHAVVGGPDELRRLADDLTSAGFPPPTLDGRRLVVRRTQPLDPREISEVSVMLGAQCRLRGLVYDGWRLARGA